VKNRTYMWAGAMAQVVEHLSSKCKALRSNPTTTKKKKNKKKPTHAAEATQVSKPGACPSAWEGNDSLSVLWEYLGVLEMWQKVCRTSEQKANSGRGWPCSKGKGEVGLAAAGRWERQ
jgi:hypothetical protein